MRKLLKRHPDRFTSEQEPDLVFFLHLEHTHNDEVTKGSKASIMESILLVCGRCSLSLQPVLHQRQTCVLESVSLPYRLLGTARFPKAFGEKNIFVTTSRLRNDNGD
ncbi:hypothetical protein DY000_02002660 [Brassica cretica]|uniref:PORR domain-containing protein n=1 Tax=Brassica cretica TaxID=69181 RepID=A0ABQ7CIF9_BRACR|nr:hypothetical protein DY000_02002660 [Brassica cretica]